MAGAETLDQAGGTLRAGALPNIRGAFGADKAAWALVVGALLLLIFLRQIFRGALGD